ncbi:AAA domain-containing protein [Ralstonia wenshanensis]|uniref:AAA domain-containing protein n=1 Tax=Ralstonia wenshanensis TaxID=2842456 RepID=UPI002AAEECBC|nr:AAA domain-containing protein [Ralstonia wenshanensis]MDY7508806.1 AAA domain-containing protein [Ralstonia wenshanensis]
MATAPAPLALRVSKKTLSMFLRTRCDKELFFSLHDPEDMAAAGLPEPIKRPGIGILAVQGKEFEVDRNDQLVRLFPGTIKYAKAGTKYADKDLLRELSALTSAPALILQGRFSIGAQQAVVLGRLGLSAADVASVPPLSDFIPDVVYVKRPDSRDMEVRPDGTRLPIDPATEGRLALSVIDIKHTAEANPSYCSEIAMYALMMANWLDLHPTLRSRYFVSVRALLWTRAKQGDSQLEALQSQGGATTQQLLDALVNDSEDAQLRFYLAAIRGFFEDVVRVIRIGRAHADGWRDLDWHVASSCGSCDWLGDKRHMGQRDRGIVDAQPGHYCMPLAEASGHLCLVPGVTRGAKKVLYQHTVQDTPSLAAAVGHPALQQHTLLKREAKTLPARSTAITTGTLSRDPSAAIASLVPSAHLLLYASVNFDSSSGLLTGLSLSGVATNFTAGQSPRRFQPVPFVVDQKTLVAEWVALEGFLTQIAGYIDVAETMVTGTLSGQIHFWEQRQFQELCNAMGRHLPRVMALSVRKAKALAWVFPAEDMIARPDSLDAATIVAVDDIVMRLVFAPSRHVITLFDTAEHYRVGPSPAVHDSYYREYLSNGIPRERIYEIWSNSPQVKRGASNIPRNTVIAQYSDALGKQCRALEAVCEKLRQDYRGQFRARAARIPTSIPQGARSVAFDSKLWLWWDELDFNASQLEAHIKLSMDGERLEASYEAIVLQNGVHVSGDEYEFDVAPSSTEAKFKEESMLTLGKLGQPGMPLQRPAGLLRAGVPAYAGNTDVLMRPFWSIVEAKLVSFDRQHARARVQLRAKNEPQLVPYLIANAAFPLLHDVFLVETKKPALFNWAEHSAPILSAIGDPRVAAPDPNAAQAMGITPPARRGAGSPETPPATVLWNPAVLEQKVVVPASIAQALAASVKASDGLNTSQEAAVAHAIERGLTLIWGPPGTGKTNTLAAMLHAMVAHAVSQRRPLRILVTGPTYKAIEEVVHRAVKLLSADPAAPSTVYIGYSQGRTPTPAPAALQPHVDYRTMFFVRGTTEYQNCLVELASGTGVTLVGCQVRQARQFAKQLASAPLHEVFDVVVIDESSQVPVSHALAAFSGLKTDARLVIAGDHLQMPPIASIEAPADAAYLVGSIQTYLSKRPFPNAVGRCVLERNYRSNEHVVEFARSIGYPSTLSAEYPQSSLHFMRSLPAQSAYPGHLPWCDAIEDLLRPDTKVATLLHEDDISSQGNRYEAQVVAGMVWMLRQTVSVELDGRTGIPPHHRLATAQEFWKRSVGIVTPHRAQRALVIQELENLWPTEADLVADAVDTVERFQGGERHTIIVTFGVADVDIIGGEEAFLMQLERTNVAVSRAMAKCVVVMPDALAAHIPEDKRALETAYALKDYVEEFCNQRVTTTLSLGGVSRWAQVRFRT